MGPSCEASSGVGEGPLAAAEPWDGLPCRGAEADGEGGLMGSRGARGATA